MEKEEGVEEEEEEEDEEDDDDDVMMDAIDDDEENEEVKELSGVEDEVGNAAVSISAVSISLNAFQHSWVSPNLGESTTPYGEKKTFKPSKPKPSAL